MGILLLNSFYASLDSAFPSGSFLSELDWRFPREAFEGLGEVEGVAESELVGQLLEGVRPLVDGGLGELDSLLILEFGGRDSPGPGKTLSKVLVA